ncbi:MAG TPA: ATP synthase F1 subunit epsilon [Bacteroidales bacterium]|nr:ATP synthase F1 subunit epsilon [Bacteroidales bacterium]
MYLEIITPEKKLFSGEIKLVQIPGSKGSFEILQNHAPIISTLENGQVKVVDPEDKITYFDIEGGVVEAKANNIIVLAEVS